MSRQMKDSGIEWIGEIPCDWYVERLKNIYSFGKGLPITKENLIENGIPVISYGQIHAKYNTGVNLDESLMRFVGVEYIETNEASLVHEGDIIVADTSEDLDGCGNCVYVDKNMTLFAGYHTIILKARKQGDYKYIAYQMKTDAWRSQIRGKASGVKVFSISKRMLSETEFVMPPLDVRRRIVAYLDQQCAHIDTVIEKTKASIEEYKKLKQAVITQAVTKGVRGDRPMKDSGIEWIGEIPAGWECRKLRSLCEIISKGTTPKDMFTEFTNEYVIRYFKSENIVNNELTELPLFTITESIHENELKRSQLSKRDLLFVIAGASIGKVAIVEEKMLPANTNQATSFIRLKNDYIHIQRYLWYVLQSNLMKEYINIYAVQSAQPNMSMEDLGCFKIPLPKSQIEIGEIVAYLDNRYMEMDRLIYKKEQVVQELELYKKSFVYEYVTGKKEVPVS